MNVNLYDVRRGREHLRAYAIALHEAFPEYDDRRDAERELLEIGMYRAGGGAAPLTIVRVAG